MLGTFDYVVEDLEDVWRDIERSSLKSEGRTIQLLLDRAIELANEAARKQRLLKKAKAQPVVHARAA
jgi:hypothetical protein